jgi:putative copper resistance protein D
MIADVSALAAAATAVINLALAIIAGVLAARLWLGTAPTLRAPVLACWVAIAAAALILLLDQAAQLTETGMAAAWDAAYLLATSTFSGQAMAAVGVLAALAAVLTAVSRKFVPVALLAFGAVTAIRATMGHAGEAGIVSLPVFIEWGHLLAMSLWVGCVIVSGWIVLPALSGAGDGPALPSYAVRMSNWATVALVVIIASGVFNTDRVLASWSDLIHTGYGKLLLAKIALVLVALGLGGINRLIGIPALRRAPRPAGAVRQFILVLRIESLVLAGVVLLAAVLTNASPHG